MFIAVGYELVEVHLVVVLQHASHLIWHRQLVLAYVLCQIICTHYLCDLDKLIVVVLSLEERVNSKHHTSKGATH